MNAERAAQRRRPPFVFRDGGIYHPVFSGDTGWGEALALRPDCGL